MRVLRLRRKNETDPPLSYIGEDYRIVYAEGDAAAKSAAESAAKSVLGYGGEELSVVSDSVAAEGKEIIVGPAGGREYSAYTSKMAKKNGWFVGVLGGDIYIQTNTGSYGGALGAFEQYFVRQAFGGRGWLLKDGQLNDICFGDGDALGANRHPRTAVGWRENGDLIFAVADGRQDGYSDGVNLCDLALLMQSYGAVGAQNLDGGGSSTFVTKNADGTLSVKNKPSNANNALRAVGDCLVLVRKV